MVRARPRALQSIELGRATIFLWRRPAVQMHLLFYLQEEIGISAYVIIEASVRGKDAWNRYA